MAVISTVGNPHFALTNQWHEFDNPLNPLMDILTGTVN